MKKYLLITFGMIVINYAQSQCTPDPQFTTPGIYPDSATNFLPAYVGQVYEQIVTAVVPVDTVVEIIPGMPQTIPIDSILVTNIIGLPPNFSYECPTSNCAFYGGSSGCLRIFSTVTPIPADTGNYPLIIELTAYSVISQSSTLDYYFIDVLDTAGGNNVEEIEGERIKLGQNVPNPVDELTYIEFISGTNTEVVFSVINLLGQDVHHQTIFAKRGRNMLTYNAGNLKPGIYLYTIDNGYVKYSKKMTVK